VNDIQCRRSDLNRRPHAYESRRGVPLVNESARLLPSARVSETHHELSKADDADSPCRFDEYSPLLDAALADVILGGALRGLADRLVAPAHAQVVS
jgi:hypothetical protein